MKWFQWDWTHARPENFWKIHIGSPREVVFKQHIQTSKKEENNCKFYPIISKKMIYPFWYQILVKIHVIAKRGLNSPNWIILIYLSSKINHVHYYLFGEFEKYVPFMHSFWLWAYWKWKSKVVYESFPEPCLIYHPS